MRSARGSLQPASWALLGLLGLCGCSSAGPRLTVLVPPPFRPIAREFFSYVPRIQVNVVATGDAAGALDRAGGTSPRIALVTDPARCAECYRIEGSRGRYLVRGGGVLGLQYGLAELLEAMGVRFFHPQATFVPATLGSPDASPSMNRDFAPAQRLRGLHLHTIHPIEAYWALWAPGAGNPSDDASALEIVDWIIKNRGNDFQWCALDDVYTDAAALERYRSRSRAVLDDAHARGLRVGLAVELFSTGNLQKAADLIAPGGMSNPTAAARGRLAILLDGLPFDRLNVSFGEFFGTDPTTFVQSLDAAWEAAEEVAPGIEMAATIHVGNFPNLRVTDEGRTMLYYFLVQFADPHIIPWIHTVMYYDLFEDAGGAYLHDDFSEHRRYLLDRLRAGLPVGYFPETAYWVAFDDSVPLYLPLYQRSRWLDLSEIAAQGAAPLPEEILFSSGWEWGYWQNDVAALRMSYELPARWDAPLRWMFEPWGAKGAALAAEVAALGELQHDFLIGKRLAAYLAGRDVVLDAGRTAGIVSQPDRPSFADVAAMAPEARSAFVGKVLQPLEDLAARTKGILDAVDALGIDPEDPWLGEVRDGVAIDAERARFAAAAYATAVSFAEGVEFRGGLDEVDRALEGARGVVAHRDARLHARDPRPLLDRGRNSTIYGYGYLHNADTLCYWRRERGELRNLVLGESNPDPGCAF